MQISNDIINELYLKASKVMETAYVPYSKFKVGAAILDEKNQIHIGSNVENSAYPVGNCAEASAISAMISSRGKKIIAIAVTGYGNMLCTPCGGCRQRIREFSEPNTPVIIGNENGIQKVFTLNDLLPFSFGPENLNENN